MITITTPIMETVAGGVSISNFITCGGIASALLIAVLIMQELLDSDDPAKQHHKRTTALLDVAVQPLSLIFAITIVYKIMEVMRF